MQVKAREGIKVPKEHKPREYITDKETETVPDTQYYRARVLDGDLVKVTTDKQKGTK